MENACLAGLLTVLFGVGIGIVSLMTYAAAKISVHSLVCAAHKYPPELEHHPQPHLDCVSGIGSSPTWISHFGLRSVPCYTDLLDDPNPIFYVSHFCSFLYDKLCCLSS